MPGMMDTILNLGLNEKTVEALIAKTGNPRFAYDSYRRFVQMYGDVVLGLKPVNKDDIDPFEVIIEAKKHQRGVRSDTDLTAEDLKDLVAAFKAASRRKPGTISRKIPWSSCGAPSGGLQLLDERSGPSPIARCTTSLKPGAGRQRPGDGLRQHGQRFRNRRRLQPATRPAAKTSFTANI